MTVAVHHAPSQQSPRFLAALAAALGRAGLQAGWPAAEPVSRVPRRGHLGGVVAALIGRVEGQLRRASAPGPSPRHTGVDGVTLLVLGDVVPPAQPGLQARLGIRHGHRWHAWTEASARAAVAHAIATEAPRIELVLWLGSDPPRARTTAVVPIHVSVHATAANLDASAAAFVADELARVARLGVEVEAPCSARERPAPDPIPPPAARTVVTALAARVASRVVRRQRGERDQWTLAWRARVDGPLRSGEAFSILDAPPGDDWADPFLWREGDREVLWFERAPAGGRGEIWVMAVGPQGPDPATARCVITRPHHLSFPTLFRYDGALYLTMESGEGEVTELLRCVVFPDRWEPASRILEGVALYDPVLLEHDGRWYLLGTAAAPGEWGIRTLQVWHAPSPLAEVWTPHPDNPVCVDPAVARNAGVPFHDGAGHLVRPSQYCHGAYGVGLNVMRVDRLDPERVEQTRVERYVPTDGRCHTWTRSRTIEAVDLLRTVRQGR